MYYLRDVDYRLLCCVFSSGKFLSFIDRVMSTKSVFNIQCLHTVFSTLYTGLLSRYGIHLLDVDPIFMDFFKYVYFEFANFNSYFNRDRISLWYHTQYNSFHIERVYTPRRLQTCMYICGWQKQNCGCDTQHYT